MTKKKQRPRSLTSLLICASSRSWTRAVLSTIYTTEIRGESPMLKLLVGLLTVFLLQTSADAADKVRISIANLSGQFMTFALAHKRGFLKEEGIEAEIIRVTGG